MSSGVSFFCSLPLWGFLYYSHWSYHFQLLLSDAVYLHRLGAVNTHLCLSLKLSCSFFLALSFFSFAWSFYEWNYSFDVEIWALHHGSMWMLSGIAFRDSTAITVHTFSNLTSNLMMMFSCIEMNAFWCLGMLTIAFELHDKAVTIE